jgi:hypothetical protein
MLSDCEGVNISEEIIKPDFEDRPLWFSFSVIIILGLIVIVERLTI